MKLTVKLILFFAISGALMTLTGCPGSKNNPVPATDTQIDKLSKTWKVVSVTIDDGPPTPATAYDDFTLTFSGTHGQTTLNYTTAGRPATSPWDASGTFTFNTTNPLTQMTRNDAGDPINFTYSVSDAQLQLSFTYPKDGGFSNRVEVVKGPWVFTMAPK